MYQQYNYQQQPSATWPALNAYNQQYAQPAVPYQPQAAQQQVS